MKDEIYIGVDIGTQSIRAIAITHSGVEVASHSVPLKSNRAGLVHEQPAEDWLNGSFECLRKIVGELDPALVKAISISATSGTVVVVNSKGEPVGPGIMYDDARGAKFASIANEADPDYWERLGYAVQGSWGICEIAWLSENGFLTPGHKVICQPDLITWALAGKEVPSDTSHSLKLGFDIDNLVWPSKIFAALKVSEEFLPSVALSGELIGVVCPEASAITGLPVGCEIVAGMTDGCAAQISSGALAVGDWNSVLGTTLVVKGASASRLRDVTGAVYSHRAPFNAGWWPGGASSTGASSINYWLRDVDRDKLKFSSSELKESVIFYPLVGKGERFPFVSEVAEAFAVGGEFPSLSENGVQLTFAAIAKGLAFTERLCFDLLDFTGYKIDGTISFSGGGTNNSDWTQLRCTVLGVEVAVPKAKEGALGMAILAAVASEKNSLHGNRLSVGAERILGEPTLFSPNLEDQVWLLDQYLEFIDALIERSWISTELWDYARKRALK